MYECVSNCGENYLYSINHPTSSTIVCVQQCPASSPLLKSEVFNQTYPISCVANCKSDGKYLYKDGSYSYCVDDCSVYGQYHSAMSSAQEARNLGSLSSLNQASAASVSQTRPMMTTKPVRVQITMVSRNTPRAWTQPWSQGCLASEAAAGIVMVP